MMRSATKWTQLAALVAVLMSSGGAVAGVTDSPLPTFSDAQPAQLVALLPTVVKNNDVESVFICTNLDSVAVNIGVEVFDKTGAVGNSIAAGNGAILNVGVGATVTIATSVPAVFAVDAFMTGEPNLKNGTGRIVATSRNVACIVMLTDELHTIATPVSLVPAPTVVSAPVWRCGNLVVDPFETCDDGNFVGGDGCDANCQVAIGPTATPTATSTPTPRLTCTPGAPNPTPTPVSAKGLKCQRAVIKGTTKFVSAEVKALQKCHESVMKNKLGPDPGPGGGQRLAFCLGETKTAAKIAKAAAKIGASITKACGGSDRICGTFDTNEETPEALGYYVSCPDFAGCAGPITSCDDISACIACIGEAGVDQSLLLYYDGLVDTNPGSQKALNKCQLAIGKETAKFFAAKAKNVAKCWDARMKGKHGSACPDASAPSGSVARKTAEKIAKAESSKITKICKACGGADKKCDDPVSPVNPLTPVLGGTGAGDDFTPAAIGFPATCNDLKVPQGGPFCEIAVTTLADLVECVDCVTEFEVDCIDAARVPHLQGRVYPCECTQ